MTIGYNPSVTPPISFMGYKAPEYHLYATGMVSTRDANSGGPPGSLGLAIA
jgi:hypothetical protein